MLPNRHMRRRYAVPTLFVATITRVKPPWNPASGFFKWYAPLRNSRSEVCARGALLGD